MGRKTDIHMIMKVSAQQQSHTIGPMDGLDALLNGTMMVGRWTSDDGLMNKLINMLSSRQGMGENPFCSTASYLHPTIFLGTTEAEIESVMDRFFTPHLKYGVVNV